MSDDNSLDLVGRVRLDMSELNGAADKTTGIFKSIAGVAATAFAGVQIKNFFEDSITGAVDLQKETERAGSIFGPASKSVQDFAEGAATAFGLSADEALKSADSMGTWLKTMGVGPAQAAGMSEGLVKLSGDMASFNDTDPETMLQAMEAGLHGNQKALKPYGVSLDEVSLQHKALALGIWDGKGALDASQKTQAAYGVILDQTAAQQGAFTKNSGDAANQQRTLKAEFSNVKEELGTALLPVINTLTTFLAKDLPVAVDLVKTGFKEYKPEIEAVAGVLTAALLPALTVEAVGLAGSVVGWVAHGIAATVNAAIVVAGWAATGAAAIASGVETAGVVALYIGDWIAMAAGATLNAATVVAGWVATGAAAVAGGIASALGFVPVIAGWIAMAVGATAGAIAVAAAWLIAIWPIALVIAAVVGLAILIYENWGTIKKYTIEAWDAVSKFVSKAWDDIWGFVSGGIKKVVNLVEGIGGAVARAAGGAFDAVKNGFIIAIDWIIDKWNGLHFKTPKIGPIDAIDIGVPQIPRLATGGTAIAAGLAMVGENGPELLSLSRGASIIPLPSATAQPTTGPITVNINGVSDADGVRGVIPELVDALRAGVGRR